MRRVVLRADANHTIGWGHLSRMVALGEMLENHFELVLISDARMAVSWPSFQISSENAFLELLNEGDIVVLDGYHFSNDLHIAIKSRNAKLVCIDDFQHQPYFADVILNHAPGVNPEHIQALPETKFLLGPKYALLKKVFLEPYTKSDKRDFQKVLISFGGSDIKDLAYSVTKMLLSIDDLDHIDLVLGKDYHGNSHQPSDPRISIHVDLSAVEMRTLMRDADFAIVPSSTTLLECLSQKLSCISGYYVDNQQAIFNGFKELGLIVPLGNLEKCTTDNLQTFIHELRNLNTELLSTIFDGKSGSRIIDAFNEL